jgi:hypothetical protein
MNTVFQELAERIRGEMSDMEQVVERVLRVWPQAQQETGEQDVYLDSVALNLHSFYTGIESLFELIARHIDGTLPTGQTWHRDLLQQMTQDVSDVRPAVIGQDSVLALDEFRRFRHIVRHVYTINLEPDRMAEMIATLPELWSTLRAELLAFADFVEELATPDDASDSEP